MRVSRLPRLARAPLGYSHGLATIAVSPSSSVPVTEPSSHEGAESRPHHAVMSISGRDRPGIVQSVTETMLQRKANMEESRMAILGGDFAMIVYISLNHVEDADKLASQLRNDFPSFSVSVRETIAPTQSDTVKSMWSFTLEGPDNPGIVASVSQALVTNGCNVHDMDTETTTAPFAGYVLFKVNAKVSVDETKLDQLSKALNSVEDKYGSTVSLIQD